MALSILDGNQSATTLSSVVTGGEHIVAHSVVSLGSNAISNITTAISGSTVCVGNLGLLQSTVATEGLPASGSFIKIGGHTGTSTTGNIVHVSAVGALRVDGSAYTQPISIASVTIGNTVTIAGTVTANPTGTQTIAGTVTIGAGTAQIGSVTASIGLNSVGPSVIADSGFSVFTRGMMVVGGISTSDVGSSNEYRELKITSSGEALVRGTVTIGSLPALVAGTAQIGSVTASISNSVTISSLPSLVAGTAQIGVVTIGNIRRAGDNAISQLSTEAGSNYLLTVVMPGTSQIGSVTASISNSVTIASLPAISGTVTANLGLNVAQSTLGGSSETQPPSAVRIGWSGEELFYGVGVDGGGQPLPIQIYLGGSSGENVTTANPLPISGTVTANSSNGSLTTRFGSVTTANTAFATSAVTNTNRKYLLIQNVTTASNVITVGIGFTPTTTQGIQLFAGAGLTFEGSYIPTGAVNLLSSVTASCFTILEA